MDCSAFIEISKGSNLKYEFDKENQCLVLDRVLHNSNIYPYNYGYIPKTLSGDGDPLDIIIICDYAIHPGTMIMCKIIGGIYTEDENGIDDKIIAVLIEKSDPKSRFFNDISDINEHELNCIKYFLQHYKDGEKNKFVMTGNFYGREHALQVLDNSIAVVNHFLSKKIE
jgi:inorganic pyrophosphatase